MVIYLFYLFISRRRRKEGAKNTLIVRDVASFARSGGKIKIRGAKVFAVIRRLFLAEIKSQIFRPKAGDLQKKKKEGLRRNLKAFSGRNRKF